MKQKRRCSKSVGFLYLMLGWAGPQGPHSIGSSFVGPRARPCARDIPNGRGVCGFWYRVSIDIHLGRAQPPTRRQLLDCDSFCVCWLQVEVLNSGMSCKEDTQLVAQQTHRLRKSPFGILVNIHAT